MDNSIICDHHPKFLDEIEKFIQKHCSPNTNLEQTIDANISLIKKQVYGGELFMTPSMFGPSQGFGAQPIYWLKIAIAESRLRKSQLPKCYLYVGEDYVSFLCCDSHTNNYKDSVLRETAKKRLEEMFNKWRLAIN